MALGCAKGSGATLNKILSDPSIKEVAVVASALGADLESGLTSQEASRRLSAQARRQGRAMP